MANISYGVNILPKTNNAYTLGNSDYKWNIYGKTANIENVKSNSFTVGERQANTTVGYGSCAIGDNNIAAGYYSVSIGNGTLAHGAGSFATGYGSNALGNFSSVFGYNTTAKNRFSMAIGMNNVQQSIPYWVSGTSYSIGDIVDYQGTILKCKVDNSDTVAPSGSNWEEDFGAVFAVGNGISPENKSNALTLLSEGKLSIKGDMYVNANADGSGGDKVLTAKSISTISVSAYGAVGDGITDDSAAIQDAVDAGYDIYFDSNKTYYIASPITIDHDCRLHGGENTTIKTVTPSGGTVNNAFIVSGTLKDTVSLTTDYTTVGATANSGNQFTFDDMSEVEIGDVLVITAEDQYYSLLRQGYYLGATLLVSDKYDGHIYTSNSMPWDITNTEDVSVKVYSAPTVIFENLNFVSDLSSRGNYIYFIQLNQCKNSIIRNCNMTTMDNGIRISHSVNTLVEDVTVSKSKYDNSLSGDGYGIYIYSCSNTIIKRVLAICAQGCLDLGGDIPNIDTFVQECNLSSECRAVGIDMHENSYNIVLEDSTFGGVSIYGTATINRCRFIKNNRVPTTTTAIIFRGSHNADWAKLKVTNCIFDGDMQIQLGQHYPQNPISSFDNIYGSVIIKDCEGGDFYYEPATSATVLSNTVNELIIDSWKNCYRIRRSGLIKHLVIRNSTFRYYLWLNDSNAAHGIYTDDIEQFDFSSETPPIHRLSVDKDTRAEVFTMTENSPITFSSSNENAKYIVCGKNFVSNNANDYIVGQVTGNVGADLSRTVATYSNPPEVSFDSDGSLIYTQKNNTSSAMVYPFYLVYAKEHGQINLSATLKNMSSTDGAGFYPYICIIDCDTGKVSYRGNGTKKTATSEGVTISHTYGIDKNHAFIYLFSCSTPVANSISKFENLKCTFTPDFNASAETDEPFIAKRITGNGTITSFDGINNIMSSELNFHVKLKTDNICTPGLSVKDNPVFTGSISMGRTANTTVGTNSVAIGDHCEASAEESHAEGRYTTASGYYSHAEGNYTFATGMGAHAEGMVTIANHASQHAYGEYNVPDSSAASATSRGNYVEIVGNGTAANAQSNARALDWSGNEYLKGDVYVHCDADSANGSKLAKVSELPTTMTGATSSTAGASGLVPAPATTDVDKFLAGDGTYKSGGLPMVILSYGSSTWAEFEAAYNNNVIVYCRASSNSNPASGSQTRMAFMAYVNNATTPTEVEFQYYRSMSAHSATAMGDQVFVYKLTKTSGWSVTTRDASIKQIKADTGTALGVSWSSNVVTLTNTMTAADMPMSSSDATKVGSAISTLSDQMGSLIHMTNFKPTTDTDGDAFLGLYTSNAIIVGIYPVRTGEDGTYASAWFLAIGGNADGTAFGFKAYKDNGQILASQKVSVNVYWISASHFSNQ